MTPTFSKILSELRADKPYNLHSHTQWCDGRATAEEMARAAFEGGMTHYGLSPHSPLPIPSPCNMSREAVGVYLAEANRLRELYHGRMAVLASMEIDYLSADWGPAIPYFQSLPLDYRIGSVHFVPDHLGGFTDVDGSPERFARYLRERFDGDLHYVIHTFFDQTEAMIAAGGFDIIGHFDKIGYNASTVEPGIDRSPWYNARIERIIEAIAAAPIAAEINTKALDKTGRFFPARDWWSRMIKAGIPLVVNSDAHFPGLINAGRSEALAILDTLYDQD